MAVSVVNTWTGVLDSNGTDVVVNVGSITENNTLIAVISKDDDVALSSVPSGWIQIIGLESNNAMYLEVYKKQATASEPASYTFTGDSEKYIATIMELGASDYSTIAVSVSNVGSDSTPISPTITPATDYSIVISGFGSDGYDPTISLDGQLTEVVNTFAGTSDSSATSMAIGYLVQSSAGSTGTFTHSLSSSEQWVAFTITVEQGELFQQLPSSLLSASGGNLTTLITENRNIGLLGQEVSSTKGDLGFTIEEHRTIGLDGQEMVISDGTIVPELLLALTGQSSVSSSENNTIELGPVLSSTTITATLQQIGLLVDESVVLIGAEATAFG